ncbi:ABC transporter ATP-binding protein [Rhizobium laguerreae]|uniref:ABC transporter ATP-binding protein n=1 Tax=Rhizobium laguerreae TaxID=1076926 RepID=UPI001C91D3A4|nr:ABC transporter ATP-binding protein [Rhizobium laguerreae]MBY3363415.1 ABC transporter ATP-binding protein [Rhizobium laguerreae]
MENDQYMFGLVVRVVRLLDSSQRRRALVVLILSLVAAILETIGVGSIVPFMLVVASPEKVQHTAFLSEVYNALGFSDVHSFAIFMGICVIAILLLNNTFRALSVWATLKFSSSAGHEISHRIFTQYLYQPYRFFLETSSADLRRSVLGEVQSLVGNVLVPMIDIASKAFIVLALLLLLLAANPIVSITIGGALGGVYVALYWFIRRWLLSIGQQRIAAQTRRHRTVNEAILGIKNIKITGDEHTYLRLFDDASTTFTTTTVRSGVVSQLPRYALEVIAFGGIVTIVLIELSKGAGLGSALPILTLYAFAGYRILPNFQLIFSSMATLRFNAAVFDKVEEQILQTKQGLLEFQEMVRADHLIERLPFTRSIELKHINFRYNETRKAVFKDFNLNIASGSTVGLVGKTGSGKTTLVDVISALLSPSSGQLLIDGRVIDTTNQRQWQKNIAYVGQQIYLTENSLKQNIAFGVPKGDIDLERVRWASRTAAIDDFIERELPAGYDTYVGENGAQLSGGQRQRIAIARALYLDRPVIILDEATSALDAHTERSVMASIDNLKGSKTIIIITHKMNNLENVDQVVEL